MPSGVYIRKPRSDEHRKKLSEVNKGKILSEEHKKKISMALKGKCKPPRSKEHLRKLSEANKGKIISEESKVKMRNAQKGIKHWNWKGGLSHELYSIDWTQTLRRSIRERDHYTCQLCSKLQSDRAFCVHHVDYNKKDCNPTNLITLCNKCSTRVNFNREYWITYFTKGE